MPRIIIPTQSLIISSGFSAGDDSNSYWLVQGGDSTDCQQGTPVTLGMQVPHPPPGHICVPPPAQHMHSQIRLTHVSTKRNLHSHHVSSPLTHQQEVSCYGKLDASLLLSQFAQCFLPCLLGEQGEGDAGDNWSVESDGASSQFWERGKPVQLKHTVIPCWARPALCRLSCNSNDLSVTFVIFVATFALCLRCNRIPKLILCATSTISCSLSHDACCT
jgi:hypothetical protein